MVIRRRGTLTGLVAVAASAMAGAYLWRFSQTDSGFALFLGIVLAVFAIVYVFAFFDARKPLLVADDTGLRVRLGGDWVGLTWSQIERVEVDERGRVTDGRVAVLAADTGDALDNAAWRGQVGARFNRFAYDAPLVVPYGLTTRVSVDDVTHALTTLSAGRAPVVLLDAPAAEPEPTVEVHAHGSPPVDDHTHDSAGPAVGPAVGELVSAGTPMGEERGATAPSRAKLPESPTTETVQAPAELEEDEDATSTVAADDPDQPGDDVPPRVPHGSTAVGRGSLANGTSPARSARRLGLSRPRLPLGGRRHQAGDLPAAHATAPLTSTPARRAEVTIPVRRQPTSVGMLALSERYAEPDRPLPEIGQLRRRDEHGAGDIDDPEGSTGPTGGEADRDKSGTTSGNVGLIIDATTRMSARAMDKVRRPHLAGATDEHPVVEIDDEQAPLLIGETLREARESLGLSVDELADRTRIRPFVIESMEVDNFEPCGGDFYARGHLKMLARVLGIEAPPLVAAYDDHFAAQPIDARTVFDVELSKGTTGVIRGEAPSSNWVGLIATVLVIMVIWGVAQYFTSTSGDGVEPATGPDRNAAGVSSPGAGNRPGSTAAADPTGSDAPRRPDATTAPGVKMAPGRTFVKVMAQGGSSGIRVTGSDGRVVYRGFLVDGGSMRVVGMAPLRVRAVDGGVVALRSGGEPLGRMGAPGEPAVARIPAPG
ncbi:MAG: hypothetical protein AVDCRST_MAG21-1414 [uncultured Nocardioidaceae bacterium]|uniref:Cytoskeleton protein RodZ-like C-terminal domain-containing protein n=1 Tax=uncultured Nocardioidaceae bacterium TaxID=253824 RepID=A0A6J4N7G4_9ACTN|nr:MAG: hypothetical protein AVDCRST_MAG21-1414 [uncultured Nocardioidaceae bacterium]